MSAQISKSEETLENIVIKNRPMKVAEEYELFLSDAWPTAKENLDEAKFKAEESIAVLTDILIVGI